MKKTGFLEDAEKMNVLLVTKDPLLVETMKLQLEEAVTAVNCLQEASSSIDGLPVKDYQLIMIDYENPDCDPLKLLQKIKESGGAPYIEILADIPEITEAAKLLEMGACGVTVKLNLDKAQRAGAVKTIVDNLLHSARRSIADLGTVNLIRKWNKAFSNKDEGVFIINRDFTILNCNPKFAEIVDRDFEDLLGRKCYDIVQDLDSLPDSCILCTSLRGSQFASKEVYAPHLHKHLELSIDPVYNDEGQMEYALHSIRDISERKKEEGERESLIFDLKNQVKELNCLYNISNLDEDTAVDMDSMLERFIELVTLGWLYPEVTCVRLTLEGRRYEYGRFNRAVSSISADVVVEDVKEGSLDVGYLEERPEADEGPFIEEERLLIDTLAVALGKMLERKRMVEELRRTNNELEGYDHAVSHDLKAPLSVISLANGTICRLLKEKRTEEIDDEMERVVEIMDENVGKANALVENLLALAEAGQKPAEVFNTDIRDVVWNVLSERAKEIEDRGIDIKFNDDLGHVMSSPIQMYQIFSNIIGNMIKYNSAENPEIRIIYHGTVENGAHRYLLKDNGQGLGEDLVHRIFMPFVKGEKGGTGIGLSTVEKIVKVYGGEIDAYNDNGACFDFTVFDYNKI